MIRIADCRRVATAFCRDGETCAIPCLGQGNINRTFLLASKAGPIVLQCINGRVFPHPLRVINNFARITEALARQAAGAGRSFRMARPVPTLAGNLAHQDDAGNYWRAQTYVPHQVRYRPDDGGQAFSLGQVLALFHRLATDLDCQLIEDPLPGFHDLPGYLHQFDGLLAEMPSLEDEASVSCLAAIDAGRRRIGRLAEAKVRRLIPRQIVHGDPKIDNFLFDGEGRAEGMVDLDTVGVGFLHDDLGDCLRSVGNPAGEAEGSRVSFDMTLVTAVLQGYFREAPDLLTTEQRSYIADAVHAITFELGLRFFTDHLRGDRYFLVHTRGENLARARRQFRLAEVIAGKMEEIREVAVAGKGG